ncbi:hypothetical protein [Streptomyces sp. NPDC058694]|uniref:hypothetical protein n=1 Tax=Streptomyces sp. NPDC058694 TaxID=3346603 RepID=UPI0036611976
MTNEPATAMARGLARVLVLAAVCTLPTGVAYADETNTASHNGPRIGLINVGQVDDPMEDVLEHVLLVGEHSWR